MDILIELFYIFLLCYNLKKIKGETFMINERQYIYTIYKERSFSKAAKKLYISQPALSAIVKIEGNIKELKEELENNSIDLILEAAISQDDEKIVTYFYKNEHILLAVPAKWEINNKLKDYRLTSEDIKVKKHLNPKVKEVSLAEFKDYPFITMKKGHDQYIRGLALCKKAGFIPKSIYKIDQMMTGYHIALFNESAVIFIRDLLVLNEQRSENLVYYKLDSELSTRPIYFATKKNKYLSNVCKEFLKIALEKETI